MNQPNPYAMYDEPIFASDAPVNERAEFIKKTYMHLLGAVGLFVLLEFLLMQLPGIQNVAMTMIGHWWMVLIAFLVAAGIAGRMASSAVSLKSQYIGLIAFIVIESIIFIPIIFVAKEYFPQALPVAAIGTLTLFGGMTAFIFITRKDFSFMGPALFMAAMIAVGLIFASAIFGFDLGVIFTVAIIGLMCLFILYDTSNVLHHYQTNQYVAASLALFASIATLFWYVLQLAMASSD